MRDFNKKVFFIFVFLLILVFSVNTKVFAVDLNGYDDLDDDQTQEQTPTTTTQTPTQTTTPAQTTKTTETDKSKSVKTVEQDKATQSHPQTGIFMNAVYVSTGAIMLGIITTAYIKFKKYNF